MDNEKNLSFVISSAACAMAFRRDVAVSIDFGRNATAVVAGFPYASPPKMVMAHVRAFGTISSAKEAADAMGKIFRMLPPVGVYLLEEQSKNNSDTPMMEAAFSGLASTVAGALVVHVPVCRVRNAFGLPRGNYREKKRAATAAMEKLISRPDVVVVSQKMTDYVAGLARSHDVADAVLQFMWFARVGKRELRRLPADAPSAAAVVVRATDPSPRAKKAERERLEKKEEQRKRAERALVRSGPPKKRRRKNAK